MLSLSSLHAIAEKFLKKSHLEERTVTPVTVRASPGTCFVSSAAAGQGLTERVSLWFGSEAQSVVLDEK